MVDIALGIGEQGMNPGLQFHGIGLKSLNPSEMLKKIIQEAESLPAVGVVYRQISFEQMILLDPVDGAI